MTFCAFHITIFNTQGNHLTFLQHLFKLSDGAETYNIHVTTSDVKGAGSDANVFIILYGQYGNTGRLMITFHQIFYLQETTRLDF